jgi:hypothetical protein
MVRLVDDVSNKAVARLKFEDVVTGREGNGVAVRTVAASRCAWATRSAVDRAAGDYGKSSTDNARTTIAAIAT